MIKKVLLYGVIAGVLAAGITIYSLTVKNNKIKADRETMKNHYEVQLELLKNPKEKTDEQKEVVKIVYKDKKGDDVIVEKIITKTITEKEPVILDQPNLKKEIRRFYISGTAGYSLESAISYGAGAGYNFTDWLSSGIRYDNIGKEHRIGLEMRINF